MPTNKRQGRGPRPMTRVRRWLRRTRKARRQIARDWLDWAAWLWTATTGWLGPDTGWKPTRQDARDALAVIAVCCGLFAAAGALALHRCH